MIKEWMDEYKPQNKQQAEQALREIMQEIALAGLQRSGFFEKAAFYGGTALRIFYGLGRYSEDLDFSLLKKDIDFSLATHLKAITVEFESLGMNIQIREKKKTKQTAVDSAFLKADTAWRELIVENVLPQLGLDIKPSLMIKLEVDTAPLTGFETEEKLLLKPFSFYVKCYSIYDIFAGKMHALLFRKWGERVKGRDWFDMEWYIKKGVALNLHHFLQRAKDSGDWNKKNISESEFMNLLNKKIKTVSFNRIREDIEKFIQNRKEIEIWSPAYFTELVKKLKFKK